MSITVSLPPFDRHDDKKIRAIVRLALHPKTEEVRKLGRELRAKVTARGRVVPDARKGRLMPAPPLQGEAAAMFFQPIRDGIQDAVRAAWPEGAGIIIDCAEAKGPYGVTISLEAEPAKEKAVAS